ncbi:MAG: hypothetical protein RL328_430 [Acidobacteriota bacterium]|jgi:hypothetical protein
MRKNIATLTLGLLMASVAVFAADSSLGTWKWNAAKSKSNSTNPLKNRTDVYEASPDGGIKVTRTETRADGTTNNSSYAFKYDGKEYPVKGQPFDTISAKRVDDNTTVTDVSKKGGPLRQTSRNVFSKDGKTRTQTVTGTDAAGKQVSSSYVYDKQ